MRDTRTRIMEYSEATKKAVNAISKITRMIFIVSIVFLAPFTSEQEAPPCSNHFWMEA